MIYQHCSHLWMKYKYHSLYDNTQQMGLYYHFIICVFTTTRSLSLGSICKWKSFRLQKCANIDRGNRTTSVDLLGKWASVKYRKREPVVTVNDASTPKVWNYEPAHAKVIKYDHKLALHVTVFVLIIIARLCPQTNEVYLLLNGSCKNNTQ